MTKPVAIKSPAYEIHPALRGAFSARKSRGEKDMGETQYYHDLIDIGENQRSQFSGFWETVRKEYFPPDISARYGDNYNELDKVDIGRVYSYTHVIESMVMNRDPVIEMGGVVPSDKKQIDLLEEKANLDWQVNKDLVRETKLAARDCIQTGRGIVWSGMHFPQGYFEQIEKQTMVTREAKDLAADDPVLAMSIEEVGAEIARSESEAPLEVRKTTSEQDDRIMTERVNSFRVAPEDFLIDPECHGVWNMKWCARRILSTLDAVKMDDRYKNTEDLSGTTLFDLLSREPETNHPMSPFEYVEIWEFWERREGKWWCCYIARDHDKFLVEPYESPFWIGLPVAFLEWNETGLHAYNPSDFVPIWSVFLEEKLSRTHMYDGFSREQTDRTFFDENLGMTEEDMKWFGDPETGLYCPVQNPDPERPLANYFFRPGMEPKSPDRMNYQMRIDQDIQTGIGVGPNQIGQALKSSTSASEAMEVASFARARGSHKYEATETFVGQISKIRLGIAIQHLDVTTVAKEMGPEAGETWAGIKRDWSEAEVQRMMLVVRIGSMRPVSEDSTFQKLVGILNLASAHPVMLAQLNLPGLLHEAVKSLGFRKTDGLVLDNDPQEVSAAVAAQAMMGGQGGGPGGGGSVPGTPGQAAQFAQG